MADESTLASAYEAISADAAAFKVDLPAEEVAVVAERCGFGDAELAAVGEVFAYLAKRHHESAIATLLRLSRLPQKAPKTFGNFDFARMQGRDAAALRGPFRRSPTCTRARTSRSWGPAASGGRTSPRHTAASAARGATRRTS